jgi:FKBP-type peptidyl-prolyl cis-trans isomerase
MRKFSTYFACLMLAFSVCSCDPRGDVLWEDEKNQIRSYLQDKGIVDYNEDAASGYFYYLTDDNGLAGRPNANSIVEVVYRIEGFDGTIFVETPTGETERIDLSKSIIGLQLALPNFQIGTKGYIILPSRLAYGKKGIEDDNGNQLIAPNEVLVVYVELVEVHPHF